MLKIGDEFRHSFSYTQDDVDTYARISGDTNPLHTDAEAGKASMFGRNIIHGSDAVESAEKEIAL